jgi:hypothetical protein
VYTYSVDGALLKLVATGRTQPEVREQVLGAIRKDPRVPERALLLIDAREADSIGTVTALQGLVHLFVERLGPKMGPRCAAVVVPERVGEATLFQVASGELGIRMEIFGDVEKAKDWLLDFKEQRQ